MPPARSARREVPPARTDEVQIGKQSRLLKKAQDAVQNADDVRADRVSEITTKLQSGRYRIDADGIAQRILDKP